MCLSPWGSMHIVNCRGQCTHEGSYSQSLEALCPSSVLRQARPWWPRGWPALWGPRRISVILAPERSPGLSVQKAPLSATGGTWLWEVTHPKVTQPTGTHGGGLIQGATRTRKQKQSHYQLLHSAFVSLMNCQPPGSEAQQRGSLHILFHFPTLSTTVQSLGSGVRGLGSNPDLIMSWLCGLGQVT